MISMITLKVKSPNIPIKKQNVRLDKKARPTFVLPSRNDLYNNANRLKIRMKKYAMLTLKNKTKQKNRKTKQSGYISIPQSKFPRILEEINKVILWW